MLLVARWHCRGGASMVARRAGGHGDQDSGHSTLHLGLRGDRAVRAALRVQTATPTQTPTQAAAPANPDAWRHCGLPASITGTFRKINEGYLLSILVIVVNLGI